MECKFKSQRTKPIILKSIYVCVLDQGIPDEYLCPITREIMKDPVIAEGMYMYYRNVFIIFSLHTEMDETDAQTV